MLQTAETCRGSDRLAALIRREVGWQVDDLRVLVGEHGLTLEGHAYSALARALAEIEAARLSGLPVVDNRMSCG
jgi:hypothetical protein